MYWHSKKTNSATIRLSILSQLKRFWLHWYKYCRYINTYTSKSNTGSRYYNLVFQYILVSFLWCTILTDNFFKLNERKSCRIFWYRAWSHYAYTSHLKHATNLNSTALQSETGSHFANVPQFLTCSSFQYSQCLD